MWEGLIVLALVLFCHGVKPITAEDGFNAPRSLQREPPLGLEASNPTRPAPTGPVRPEAGDATKSPPDSEDETHEENPPAENPPPFPLGLNKWNASLTNFYLRQQTSLAGFAISEPDGPNGIFILQNTSSLDWSHPETITLEPSPFSGQTLRLQWYGKLLPPDVDSTLVVDLLCNGGDASLLLKRGVLSWAGLHLFYHERFTTSDDYMQLFWANPDEDIETVFTSGVEMIRDIGPFSLNLLYADFGSHALRGFRLAHSSGWTTVGLTGAKGRGEVIGVDLGLALGFADFTAELAMANGSTEDWGFGLALKSGRLGPVDYTLEYLFSTPGFSTPDSSWSRENCERLYGSLYYNPMPGLSLNGTYELLKMHNYSFGKIERTIGATLNLLGPYNLTLTYSLLEEIERTDRFEVYLGYMDNDMTASLILRYTAARGLEQDFSISWWTPDMNSRLSMTVSFLADSFGYGFDFTKTLASGLSLNLNGQANYNQSQGQTVCNLALALTF